MADKSLLQSLVQCSELRLKTLCKLITDKVTITDAMQVEAQWRSILAEIQAEFDVDLGVTMDGEPKQDES